MASRKKVRESRSNHRTQGSTGTPTFLLDFIESAELALSRRDFVRGAGALGGMFALGGFTSCGFGDSAATSEGAIADAIYHGGSILTMIDDGDRAEALAVANGRILAVGALDDVVATRGPDTAMIHLGGKTLMPGFFDPHPHIVLQSVKFPTANLDPKPIGDAGSIADIQRILRDWIEEKHLEPGQWVIGWGYDDTGIEEQRHPNRDDLDALSTEHPILLMHISGHLMTGNSRMLEEIGVTAETADPEGGRIQRKPGSREPNGVLEENAMYLVLNSLPMPTPERTVEMLQEGLRFYAAAGITTAQDCATFEGTWQVLEGMEQGGLLPIDVITWPVYKDVDDATLDAIVGGRGSTGRLKRGGIKLIADGSIQGYTAFLSQPYHVQPEGAEVISDECDSEAAQRIFVNPDIEEGEHADIPPEITPDGGYRGYASMTQEQLDRWVKRCDDAGIQMQVHTNGDAATDMLIEAVEKARSDRPRPDLRTTIIHAQTMRDDQLDFSAQHGLTPSFFPLHVNFWGDRHRDIFLGPERAARINPARSALNRGLKITLHHDAPIAGIEMLTVAWAAVNRVTTSGEVLGPEERITPFDALRAITADAAWQNYEEERKGTLEVGKLADMVVLSDDPLSVPPMAIREIRVMETIKEGQTVFSAEE